MDIHELYGYPYRSIPMLSINIHTDVLAFYEYSDRHIYRIIDIYIDNLDIHINICTFIHSLRITWMLQIFIASVSIHMDIHKTNNIHIWIFTWILRPEYVLKNVLMWKNACLKMWKTRFTSSFTWLLFFLNILDVQSTQLYYSTF